MNIDSDNNMDVFFNPVSVAIIGITRKSGPGSYNLMENMLKYGYQHKIFPVNYQAKEILGQKAYSNVKHIEQKIDLAIIILPNYPIIYIVKHLIDIRYYFPNFFYTPFDHYNIKAFFFGWAEFPRIWKNANNISYLLNA